MAHNAVNETQVALAVCGGQPRVHPDLESGNGGDHEEASMAERRLTAADWGECEHEHYSHRAPWLRALVLGANDGLVSVASLMLGVSAVENSIKTMVVGGLAGLVAGACSMAIGEFVSVFSQRDAEKADVEKERQVMDFWILLRFGLPVFNTPEAFQGVKEVVSPLPEVSPFFDILHVLSFQTGHPYPMAVYIISEESPETDYHTIETQLKNQQPCRSSQVQLPLTPHKHVMHPSINTQEHAKGPLAQARELEELTQIYVSRGLGYLLARQVAEELSREDPVRAHARDELGIDMDDYSNPVQAAIASAVAFASGGAIPLLAGSFIVDFKSRLSAVIISTSSALALFGAVGARLGGAPVTTAAARVLVGGLLAMLVTFGLLKLLGVAGVSV